MQALFLEQMNRNLLFILFLLLLGGYQVFGQCITGTIFYYDNDGDEFGTDDFIADDIGKAITDFNDARDGQTIYYGNIAYGCTKPPGYADKPFDCDDDNSNVHASNTWYTDEDGDGAFGTRHSGCQQPPPDSSPTKNDCDDDDDTVQSLRTFYENIDGDSLGGAAVQACHQGSYLTTGGDCNDGDDTILGPTTWYLDEDDDGKGGTTTIQSCTDPSTSTEIYVTVDGDQCDNLHGVFQKNIWYFDYDNDGYGDSEETQYACTQPEGNWVNNGDDLDDTNGNITDVAEQWYYHDSDGDGYGNPSVSVYTSNPPDNYVTNDNDCDDTDDSEYPGAVWYRDFDGDGYGNLNDSQTSCLRPGGYVSNASDFNDDNKLITNVAPRTFYEDQDGDTYGNPNVSVNQSYPPSGNWVTNANDCNDADATLHNFTLWALDEDGDGFGYNAAFLTQTNTDRGTPGAHAPPAGITPIVYGCNDPSTASYTFVKNASTDYDDTLTSISNIKPQWFYPDNDKDNFGTNTNTLFQSDKPTGYGAYDGDCDDNNPLLHPQTVWYEDADGDTYGNVSSTLVQCEMPATGYVSNALDYSDTTTHVTNIKPEYFYRDADEDLYGDPTIFLYYSYQPEGYVRSDQDCDDTKADVNPDTIWYEDADGDSFGSASSTLAQCTQPPNYVTNQEDYDDTTDKIINIAPQYFYHDGDGDTYGDPNDFVYYSIRPADYVINNLDCDDTDAAVNPQKIWFQDADGDGLGTHTVTTTSCLQPDGFVENFEDLGDETKYITNIAPVPFYYDADGDGYGDPNKKENYSYAPPNYYTTGEDCNDNDIRVHPLTIWYYDKDGDGFGDNNTTFIGCVPPSNYVLKRGDLDVDNPLITDIPGRFFYRDKDGDGYGVSEDQLFQSYPPEEGGYVLPPGDCDDFDATLHPATVWYYDNDRDGYGGAQAYQGCTQIGNATRNHGDLDDTTGRITNIPPRYFYEDADGDGDGNPNKLYFGSYAPDNYVPNKRDCDDTDPQLHHRTYWFLDSDRDGFGDPDRFVQQCEKPSDNYVFNGHDYDDSTDLITNIAPQNFYPDRDGDGYGPDAEKVRASHPPKDYVSDGGDCNDNDPLLHPETHWYLDADQDSFGGDTLLVQCEQPGGYVLNTDDWDDNQACITDITPRDFYADNDNDGYGDPDTLLRCSKLPEEGYVVNNEDCDDTDDGIKPTTIWYRDGDGDGYGVEEDTVLQCEPPEGYANKKGDCDDENPYLVPSAVRVVLAQGLDPNTQELFRDCLAPDPEEITEEDLAKERHFYADRDFDGFGDPEEIILPDAIGDTIHYAVVLNGDDACPEEYGLYKGCPKALIVLTEREVIQNQELRLFVEESEEPLEERSLQVSDTVLATIEVAPNPTEGILTAFWEESITEFVSTIRVLGYQYAVEFEMSFSATDFTATIDLSPYPPDIYFVQFYLADGRGITKKIIKITP